MVRWKNIQISIPLPFVKDKYPLPTKTVVNADYDELAKEGFPKEVSKAFQKAADELNCVFWSRVPGKACTTLIDEGYNLKPFYVHGKSCNWGPMAGFVCQLPALNKKGASKIAYNLKEHLNSLTWLEEKQAEAVRDWNKEHQGEPDISDENKYREIGVSDSLFLPLSISEARQKELLDSGFLPDHETINNDLVCGIAQDKDKTVAIEYLMQRNPNNPKLWDIYHKNIYIKNEEIYINYLQKNGAKFSIIQDNVAQYNADIQASIHQKTILDQVQIDTALNTLLNSLNIFPERRNSLDKFYAINGVQSPYLVHRDEANRYKNAVSGDYDLFAIWPFTPNVSIEMATRISERASKPSESDKIQRLFIPVEAKENAVEITKSRNVFIEFIGTYKELEGKEDRELGNINDLVSLAAQTLNSLIRAQYLGKNAKDKGQFPNRAFHSDEGGRPGVDEIEYPIAFFMPKSKPLWNDLKQEESRLIKDGLIKEEGILQSTAFVVKNHVEFLSLVQLLKRRFYVFLHDGWFMHWMCLAADKNAVTEKIGNVTLPDKPRRYLEARGKEIDDLGDVSQQSIESLLRELLTPTLATATALERNAASRAFQGVAENFLELAAYQQSPDVAERKDLILPLEIKLPE